MTNANSAYSAPTRQTSANITIFQSPCGASAASIGICFGGVERRRPVKRKSCEGCVYYRPLNNARNGTKGCHYCLDTGKPRGCPIAGCVRKVKGIPDARTNPFDARMMR